MEEHCGKTSLINALRVLCTCAAIRSVRYSQFTLWKLICADALLYYAAQRQAGFGLLFFFQKNLISVMWQAIAVKSFRFAQGHDVVLVNLSRQQKGLRASKTWQLCNFNFENLLGKIRMVQLWMKTEQQASTWAKQHLAAISLKRRLQHKYFWSTIEKQIVEAMQKPATCLNSTHTSADKRTLDASSELAPRRAHSWHLATTIIFKMI